MQSHSYRDPEPESEDGERRVPSCRFFRNRSRSGLNWKSWSRSNFLKMLEMGTEIRRTYLKIVKLKRLESEILKPVVPDLLHPSPYKIWILEKIFWNFFHFKCIFFVFNTITNFSLFFLELFCWYFIPWPWTTNTESNIPCTWLKRGLSLTGWTDNWHLTS